MKKVWLWGDNLSFIQGRIMVLMYYTFSKCHPSIYYVSNQTPLYFPRYGTDKHPPRGKNARGK